MKIIDIREETKPIQSTIRNAHIDFWKTTLSLVAVVTDVVHEGRGVVGYGFNSDGRYGQGAQMRERFILSAQSTWRYGTRSRRSKARRNLRNAAPPAVAGLRKCRRGTETITEAACPPGAKELAISGGR